MPHVLVPGMPGRCITPYCPNTSHSSKCPSCLTQEASRPPLQGEQGACTHTHSITGDLAMIQRLLPGYAGGEPQHGYMLDVCKTCLKALPERPYNPAPLYRPSRRASRS
jgi:hypothetical protein